MPNACQARGLSNLTPLTSVSPLSESSLTEILIVKLNYMVNMKTWHNSGGYYYLKVFLSQQKT